jgi:hypothetical protein
MADAKNTNAKPAQEAVETKEVVQEVVKPVPTKRKELDRNMMVSCRSVVQGELTYVSKKTGLETTWSKFGDEEYIDLGELMTMKASQPKFLNNPWIMIDDTDVVEHLGLKAVYDKIIAVEELDSFFYKQVDEMVEVLKKAPKGTRQLVADTARAKVQDGSLDSMRIIKALEKELIIDLSMVQ